MPPFSAARASQTRGGVARLPSYIGSLPKFAAAKALVAAGTRNAIIHIDGDSTCVGSYANNGGLTSGNCRNYGWPAQLAAALQSVKGGYQNWFGIGSAAGVNAYPGLDSRVTPGSGWSAGGTSSQSFGYTALQANGTGQTLSFAPTTTTDTLDVYYYQGLGSGGFTINAGGGTLLTINTNVAPTAIKKATITTTAGSNTYTVVTNGGVCYIFGMEAYLSTTKEVSVRNGGIISSTAAQHIPSTTVYAPLRHRLLQA